MSGFFRKLFSSKSLCWMESVKIITDLKEDLYIAENENKIVKPIKISDNLLEISVHNEFDHPNIIKDTNIYTKSECTDFDFCREFPIYYTFPQFIREKKNDIDWEIFWKILYQLASALDYTHERNIIHCNVKNQSIFLDKDYNVKLGGFESAKLNGTIAVKDKGLFEDKEFYEVTEEIDFYQYFNFVVGFISEITNIKLEVMKSIFRSFFNKEKDFDLNDAVINSIVTKMRQHPQFKSVGNGNFERFKKFIKIMISKNTPPTFKEIVKTIGLKNAKKKGNKSLDLDEETENYEDDFYYDHEQEEENNYDVSENIEIFSSAFNKAKDYIEKNLGNKDVILLFIFTDIYLNMCYVTGLRYCQESSISALYLAFNVLDFNDSKKENILRVLDMDFTCEIIKKMKGAFYVNNTYDSCNNIGDLIKAFADIEDYIQNPDHEIKKIKAGKIKSKKITCAEFLNL